MTLPRVIDGTLAACWRHATQPLDRDAVATLTSVLPVQAPGIGATVPVVAPGAYGHDALQAVARHAHMVEPVDHAALASVVALDLMPIVVDPEPVTLADLVEARDEGNDHDNDESTRRPDWERRLVLEPHPRRELIEDLRNALGARTERLRLEDPEGVIDLALATELAHLPHAHRLTIAPSNVRGIATATAHAVLGITNGPAVIATLLGRATGGAPATEHLSATEARPLLRHAAETLALVTGRSIEPEHAYWGADTAIRRPAGHAARGDTLDSRVHQHLAEWGVTLTGSENDRLMTTLRARLRPGDRLDGPTLWATLATVTDLPARATASKRGTP